MKNRFYLACLRDNVGSNVGFHAIDGRGYTTDLSKAHVYTREEAQQAWSRDIDLPLSADHIDALAVWKVDCQCIPHSTTLKSGCDAYVAFQAKRWDGNDVYWLTEKLPSTDFSKAKIFTPDQVSENEPGLVYLPYSLANEKKRRTFAASLINKRIHVQGAGIKTPDHIKRDSRRRDSGKTRWNCPGCGKIHWQLNPYDFDGCNDVTCDEWKPSYGRAA